MLFKHSVLHFSVFLPIATHNPPFSWIVPSFCHFEMRLTSPISSLPLNLARLMKPSLDLPGFGAETPTAQASTQLLPQGRLPSPAWLSPKGILLPHNLHLSFSAEILFLHPPPQANSTWPLCASYSHCLKQALSPLQFRAGLYPACHTTPVYMMGPDPGLLSYKTPRYSRFFSSEKGK